jgi:hypothetical protein
MARQRTNQATNGGTTNMGVVFTDVTDDQLTEILAGSRTHGNYDRALEEFISSEKRAVEVPLDDGLFNEKKPSSVKTGFEGAKKRALKEGSGRDEEYQGIASAIQVVNRNDKIFLVRQAA